MGAVCAGSKSKKNKAESPLAPPRQGSFVKEEHSVSEDSDENRSPTAPKKRKSKLMILQNSSIMINQKMEFKEVKQNPVITEQQFDELITSSEDIRKIYDIEPSAIAHGNFGTVRTACLKGYREKTFAIKSIAKGKFLTDFYLLKTELEIMRALDYPNIVNHYETYQDEKNVHLVMEYLSGGELFNKILEENKLKESEVMFIVKKIFAAVRYLHDRGICHRDLKLENFIFSHPGADAEIKIIDFGLSKKFTFEQKQPLSTIVGTALYVPPEVLKGKYDYRCDLWSLGVVMFILLGGYPPFFGDDNKQIFEKVMIGTWGFENEVWHKITKQAKDLISKLIVVDPEKRITAAEALKHPWFTRFILEDDKYKYDKKLIANLRNYNKLPTITKEIFRVIYSLMSEDENLPLKETFNFIDVNHDGKITIDELKAYFSRYDIKDSDETIKRIIRLISDNEDSDHITYTNFVMAAKDINCFREETKVNAVYRYFDYNNDGYITTERLIEAMKRAGKVYGEKEIDKWLEEVGEKDRLKKNRFFELVMNKKYAEEEGNILINLKKLNFPKTKPNPSTPKLFFFSKNFY